MKLSKHPFGWCNILKNLVTLCRIDSIYRRFKKCLDVIISNLAW